MLMHRVDRVGCTNKWQHTAHDVHFPSIVPLIHTHTIAVNKWAVSTSRTLALPTGTAQPVTDSS